MARAGFYNENEYRDYPFLTQVEPRAIVAMIEAPSSSSSSSSSSGGSIGSAQAYLDLPHETIVDFGAIMGADSGFRTGEDFVWLHRIRRSGNYLLFEFRTTAPDAAGESLFFCRHLSDPEFMQDWAESRSLLLPDPFCSSSSSSSSCGAEITFNASATCNYSTYPARHNFWFNWTPAISGVIIEVERSLDGGFTWPGGFSFGPTGSPATTDSGVVPGTTHYRARITHGSLPANYCPTDWVVFEAPPPCGSSSSSASLSSSSSFPFCTNTPDGETPLPCDGPGCDVPKWEGFLITGLFGELADMLLDGEQLVFTKGVWVIEHARIQNLNNSFARSINLANRDRTHVTPPEQCSSASADDSTIFPNAVCLQGHIKFKEGYNCNIRQEDQNNALVILGAVGGGEGEACDEIPLYEGEVPPAGSPFLTGGPACGEIVRTISGKGGPSVRIFGGSGIRVFDAPANPSAIFVDADLSDFALCLQQEPGPGDPCYVGSSSSSSSSAGGP